MSSSCINCLPALRDEHLCREVRKARFVVVAGEITEAGDADRWLLRGITFDLEKRIGRLSNLETADRLEVADAVRAASDVTEQTKVTAVMDRIKPDIVLYAFGTLAETRLDVGVHVWTDSQGPAATLSARGTTDRLFVLIDDLMGKIVSHLETTAIVPGKVHPAFALHLPPARSVSTYRLVISGMASLQEGRATAARSDLQNALQAEPDNWWAHYFLGAIEFHEGRFEASAEHCCQAISLNPELYAGVYANLSHCYRGLGYLEQAKRAQDEFERRTGEVLPIRTLPGIGSLGMQHFRQSGSDVVNSSTQRHCITLTSVQP